MTLRHTIQKKQVGGAGIGAMNATGRQFVSIAMLVNLKKKSPLSSGLQIFFAQRANAVAPSIGSYRLQRWKNFRQNRT